MSRATLRYVNLETLRPIDSIEATFQQKTPVSWGLDIPGLNHSSYQRTALFFLY